MKTTNVILAYIKYSKDFGVDGKILIWRVLMILKWVNIVLYLLYTNKQQIKTFQY